jgi:hypothetical protein
MVNMAQESGIVAGLVAHLIPTVVVILQYADDIIVCLENSVEKARNLKLLLYLYEHMSGLKINFDKIEVILIGGDNNLAAEYSSIFNC